MFINKMYIRIEFDDIENYKTKETKELFFSSPNGMFLTSLNAHSICSKALDTSVVGTSVVGTSVVFWYLDIYILNKYYGGVIYCLNELSKYPGVARIDILPIEGQYPDEKFDDLLTILKQYVHGV